MTSAASSQPILIKRYAKSRLYDTRHLRYVSVDQLRAWRAADIVFSVLDTETGDDVTAVLLA